MYLFIIEEAIQTVGMACWTLYKKDRYEELQELAQWIIDEIIDPAIEFNNTYGLSTYPLNEAYSVFYASARRNMETYLDLTRGLNIKVVAQPELNIECILNGGRHYTPFELNVMDGVDVAFTVIEANKDLYTFKEMTVDGFTTDLLGHSWKIDQNTTITLFYEPK